jgi:uncharacterized FlaG/YvyC family protein
MNIESQNAFLMPSTHQATRAKPASSLAEKAPEVMAAEPTEALVALHAKEVQATRQRIAIAEKMIGANKSLIIEKDKQRVGFVYKTVDRTTGEVVRVWPQREVASALMALADGDARAVMAGMMIDASA